ncbi:hypothetical protein SAMN06297144_0862 [Sphingomonas guangdongensis]|uniref:Uncharacterized protein n=1 Tax=Sphingomonas guangdongensis TaxID=1141890 RepID=A0A285QEY0_9SPHN|nr:hypothetical protein [Sphingomonas guangdongensis]SOB80044.1 hypothetical protein SAMN06297144_0862 [Sphingomonas guangdongensis]
MSPGAKFTLAMFASALQVPLLFLALGVSGYMPSSTVARLAREHADPAEARAAIARELDYVRTSRRQRGYSHLRPEQIGVTVRRFRSWQNDEGFLATTTIDCRSQSRCTVTADALVPYRTATRSVVAP